MNQKMALMVLASGSSWTDDKAAADKALTDASVSLKNLHAYLQSQTPAGK